VAARSRWLPSNLRASLCFEQPFFASGGTMHKGQRVLEAVTDWLISKTNQIAAKTADNRVKSGMFAANE
jgi:hypothetical protein